MDARISTLEGELLAKSEQLQEAEDEIALLHDTIEDHNSHATRLSLQVIEAQKEMELARGEATKARNEATAVREVAKVAEDVVAAAADNA